MDGRYLWILMIFLTVVIGVAIIKAQKGNNAMLLIDSEASTPLLASANNTFAFDLYRTLKKHSGNLIFSPFSISSALAMVYAGARGNTEREMSSVLHFKMHQETLHKAFGKCLQELTAMKEKEPNLHVANSLWLQVGYSLLRDFLDTLAANYRAEPQYLNFVGDPEPSRQRINEWVSEQTNGKVKDLLPPGSIGTNTRLVLANAIYFSASWWSPFRDSYTYYEDFYLLNEQTISVPMMHQTAYFKYGEFRGAQAIELPYARKDLAMVVLLPQSGSFEKFERDLDAKVFDTIIESLSPTEVQLSMPKFKFEWGTHSLVGPLRELGMKDAFDCRAADFSGMNGIRCNDGLRGCLCISDVLHKALIAVDEAGTEAAAATAVVMVGATPFQPRRLIEMKINSPFIFAIRDNQTGMILFLGRVLDPR